MFSDHSWVKLEITAAAAAIINNSQRNLGNSQACES